MQFSGPRSLPNCSSICSYSNPQLTMQIRHLLSAILAFDIAFALRVPAGNAKTNLWRALLSDTAAELKAPATLLQQMFQYGTAKLKGNKANVPFEGFNTARTITVDGETVTLGEELGTGVGGTVFDIPAGFQGKDAVAKEFNIAEHGLKEIETLKEVEQFIASAQQEDEKKTLYVIMKKVKGQKLLGSANFPPFDEAKKFGVCPAFMEQVREKIADKVVKYASTSKGIVHDDYSSNGNVFLTGKQADGFDTEVDLVDWGQITLKDSQSDEDIKAAVIKRLTTDAPLNVFTDKQCEK